MSKWQKLTPEQEDEKNLFERLRLNGCCGTCTFFDREENKWSGTCGIILPPALENIVSPAAQTNAGATCSFWREEGGV